MPGTNALLDEPDEQKTSLNPFYNPLFEEQITFPPTYKTYKKLKKTLNEQFNADVLGVLGKSDDAVNSTSKKKKKISSSTVSKGATTSSGNSFNKEQQPFPKLLFRRGNSIAREEVIARNVIVNAEDGQKTQDLILKTTFDQLRNQFHLLHGIGYKSSHAPAYCDRIFYHVPNAPFSLETAEGIRLEGSNGYANSSGDESGQHGMLMWGSDSESGPEVGANNANSPFLKVKSTIYGAIFEKDEKKSEESDSESGSVDSLKDEQEDLDSKFSFSDHRPVFLNMELVGM